MRIIGGTESGQPLLAPKGFSVRPTLDRVREAIFNRLAPLIPNARVLDLFSGTGALGLECVSRGAASVLSVERSAQHLRYIKQNIRACGYQPDQIRVHLACAFKTIHELAIVAEKFDLILADPPFGPKTNENRSESLAQNLIDDSNLIHLSHSHTLIILSHATRDKVEIPGPWALEKSQQSGDTTITYLKITTETPPT
ncbi:MAG: Ribosomal RNA small subunit methyltransferase D [Verrucomicrobia subdivision 3 bacterium]|nr:Ribosomal RNA small subunit methyltransferase D [Limisphaerales bacterium]MCS1414591.1 Ribosomal RNA small subunit methyltransferase D [Limisphaerales bacterium]